MEWYYVSENRQVGPVDDEALARLFSQGTLPADTLVWCHGMENWEAYSKLSADSDGPGTRPAGLAVGQEACSFCGKVCASEDLISFESARICAACKPHFTQHLREGTLRLGHFRFAGFWIRAGAAIIDGIILGVFSLATQVITGMALADANEIVFMGVYMALSLVQMAVGAIYEIVLVGKYGATLGKMIFQLKVVTPDGEMLSYARSTGRHFSKIISQIILLVGYIMVAFDEEKRGLHDHICNTRVVHT